MVWVIALLIINSGIIKYNNLSLEFYLFLFFSLIGLYFGYFLGMLAGSVKILPKKRVRYESGLSGRLIQFFTAMVFLQFLLLFYNMWLKVGLSFDFGLLRYIMTVEGESLKFSFISVLLNPFCFLLLPLLILSGANGKKFILPVTLLTFISILGTGRAMFLVILLMSVATYHFKSGIKLSQLFLFGCLFCLFFGLVGMHQGKVTLNYDYALRYAGDFVPESMISVIIFNILTYATSGIVALSTLLDSTTPNYNFSLTMRNFERLFALFFDVDPSLKILPNAEVPFKTNVYTFLFVPLIDWGKLGTFVYMIIYGFIMRIIYSSFRKRGSNIDRLILSLLITLISLSIFHDYVFSATFPYLIVLTCLLFKRPINQL